MKEIITKIIIERSAKLVWQVLTQFENYPNWNPFIKEISGDVKGFSKFNVTIEAPNSKPIKFKPLCTIFDPKTELRWERNILIPCLFLDEHSFKLKELSNGNTELIHSRMFTGVLAPFVSKKLMENIRAGFNLMNAKLKEKVEAIPVKKIDKTLAVRKSVTINTDKNRIWNVLITPEFIKDYMFGVNVKTDWKPGSKIEFFGEYQDKNYNDKGIIEAIEENEYLKYLYWSSFSGMEDEIENYSEVSYDIVEIEGKNELIINQIGYSSLEAYNHSLQGWEMVLSKIKEIAER